MKFLNFLSKNKKKSDLTNKRKLIITIDVEALTVRAPNKHVDRLIWGHFAEGQAGISEIMDIGDKYNQKFTFFLDYCELELYGDKIIQVGKTINQRGHDLQLHAHPEFLTEKSLDRGFIPFSSSGLNNITSEQSEALCDFLIDAHRQCSNKPPIAFRGGGYRFNGHLLSAMAKRGILFQSSYNPPRKTQPLKFAAKKQFKWSTGCLEVPISAPSRYLNITQPFEFNFNRASFFNSERMKICLNSYYEEFGDDAIAVLVMHSWSMLEFDKKTGYYSRTCPHALRRFDKFISSVKDECNIMTSEEILQLFNNNELELDQGLNIDVFNNA